MNVTVPAVVIGQLAAEALNRIDDEGCCPRCCAPCHAVRTLLTLGQLDAIMRTFIIECGGGWRWWDGDRVDRAWLADAWARTDCHEPMGNHHPNIEVDVP